MEEQIEKIKKELKEKEIQNIYLNFVDFTGNVLTKMVGVQELINNTHVSWFDGISINGNLIQDFKDVLARDRKRGAMVDYSHYDVYKKENEILEKLNEKYPNVDEKFPKILSNGCEYVFARDKAYREEFQPYYQKIKEYMGEEVFKKLKNTLEPTSFCKKDEKRIPITIYTSIVVLKRTYGNYLLDDTAKGFL